MANTEENVVDRQIKLGGGKAAGSISGWLLRKVKKSGSSWFGGSSTWRKGFWIIDFERNFIKEYDDEKQQNLISELDPKSLARIKKNGNDKIVISVATPPQKHEEDSTVQFQASDETSRNQWHDAFARIVQKFSRETKNSGETDLGESGKKGGSRFGKKMSLGIMTNSGEKKPVLASMSSFAETAKKTSSFVLNGRKSNLSNLKQETSPQSETHLMLSERQSSSDTAFSQHNPVSSNADMPSPGSRPHSVQISTSTSSASMASNRKQRQGSMNQIDMTKNFMSKARNFAISINKDFLESVKRKGIFSPEAGGERSKQRAAIVPVNAPEEKIDRARFKKTSAQNDMLVQVVLKEFAGLYGGNLLREVDPQSIVDLMYTVNIPKDTCIVLQGEATDKMFVIDSGVVGVYTQDFVDRPPEMEVERHAGDSFGVLSLIYNQPAPFMIKTHSDCVLWALPSRKLHDLATSESKRRLARKVRLLDRVPLIADNIDHESVAQLADSMEFREFSKGEYVLRQGDDLRQVIVVAEGAAKLRIDDKEVDVEEGVLQKGDVFGEWALLGQNNKSEFSIQAETPTLICLCLDVTDVEELVGPLRQFVLTKWMERQQLATGSERASFTDLGMVKEILSPEQASPAEQRRRASTPPVGPTTPPAQPSPSPEPVFAKLSISAGVKRSVVFANERSERGSFIQSKLGAGGVIVQHVVDPSAAAVSTVGGGVGSGGGEPGRPSLLLQQPPTNTSGVHKKTTMLMAPLVRTLSMHELLTQEEEELALAQVVSEVRKNENLARRTKGRATAIRASLLFGGGADVMAEPLAGDGLGLDGGNDERDEEDGAENLDRPFIRTTPLRPDVNNDNLEFCALLGSGNFGKVHLVRREDKPEELYALKVLTRHYIVLNGWEKMVENERDAMLELSTLVQSPFLLKLFNSFSDSKNVYLLLELCEGGDLYNLMKATKARRFGEDNARFYFACVVLGLEAMHSCEIVYRDLKPENLMIDKTGYIKVADFGLAKKTLRTFTVCGTPEYMAPEVIMSRGHGLAVDWWAAGVLLYEILTGITPFTGGESSDVYERILNHKTVEDLPFDAEDDANLSTSAKDLIRNLMHPKKNKRLGVKYPGIEAVKSHDFFEGFEWNGLSTLNIAPPVVPTTTHIEKLLEDTKSGKNYDPKLWGAPDDHSGWTLTF